MKICFSSGIFVEDAQGSAVILLDAYRPFPKADKFSVSIDAYYPASNGIFLKAKELVKNLLASGISARVDTKLFLKPVLSEAGFLQGRNTLHYAKPFGSRFACEAVRFGCSKEELFSFLSFDFDAILFENSRCENCHACENACPSGAISSDGYERKKCARDWMDHPLSLASGGEKLGASVLGCDICQRVCPMNDRETQEMPKALADFLRLPTFLRACAEGKRGLKPISDLVGENMARPQRMTALGMLVAKNAITSGLTKEEAEELSEALSLFLSKEEEIAARARCLIKEIKGET